MPSDRHHLHFARCGGLILAACVIWVCFASSVRAAPRAFYFKAVWAQSIFTVDPENNLGIGNPTSGIALDGSLVPFNQPGDALDGVVIYDDDAAVDITDQIPPTGFCDTCDPSNQAFYVYPGPVNDPLGPLGQGKSGFNFARTAKLSTPADDDLVFPRGQSSSGGGELDPLVMKVANDAPNPLGPTPPFLDAVNFVDHMDMSATGAGSPHRLELAFVSVDTGIASLDPLPSIDLDDFNPPATWGFSLLGSAAVIDTGHPFVPGELREISFGDGNLNGIVGPEDYTIWANGFGTGDGYGTGATDDAVFIDGDFSINGMVGPEDYTIWANTFGEDFTSPAGADAEAGLWANNFGSSVASTTPPTAVPEPGGLSLAGIGLCGLSFILRRGPRRHTTWLFAKARS